jgi:hypothetical protein
VLWELSHSNVLLRFNKSSIHLYNRCHSIACIRSSLCLLLLLLLLLWRSSREGYGRRL